MNAMTNAERQALYKQRLKEAAKPAWIRKDFERTDEAAGNIQSFRDFFGHIPRPGNLELFSRRLPDGGMALLAKMPWPLGEVDTGMMKGWRLAKEDAEDLGFWHREI